MHHMRQLFIILVVSLPAGFAGMVAYTATSSLVWATGCFVVGAWITLHLLGTAGGSSWGDDG